MFGQNLQTMNNVKFNYDSDHDVLYVYFGEPKISYDDETAPGIFLRLAEENDSLTGFIIMDYKKQDPKKLSHTIPINFNFSTINNSIH
ncbi:MULTISPECIES: DUF2283 domain-containing protein [Bacillus cereus group]|uniref:DUF2283 domain-containing protein n=1 Tax=Bacillus cereus group TaxID=86661 RepID=UPI000BFE9914|nr:MULTISPECIES: DUF2283 domain-containing protein [Bacillus cereus group]PHD95927.1 hypothetical protein COF43_23110 [Bacillus toyonensis]PHE20533.1 hypothetical protein COF41_10700 [Bacillus toyonensis]TEX16552.1 DUF2283 domain-containing protein [Bacillus cereus]